MIRYEVETRWIERGKMLAWGFACEYKRREDAIECCKNLEKYPRKVCGYETRLVEVTYNSNGRVIHRQILTGPDQLEFDFGVIASKFISGIAEWKPGERLDA